MRVTRCLNVMMLIAVVCTAARADRVDYNPKQMVIHRYLPAINLANQPLENVLDQIKTKMPDFNFVVFREPGTARDYPVLPAMTLGTVTIGQFFELIGNEYPVKIQYITNQVDADSQPLCEFHINGGTPATKPAATQPSVVRVFGLAELIAFRSVSIEGVEKREDRDKQASNEILSMIQAALDVAGDPTVPVMKMHAPTKTLIFKGTEAQAQIVESAIKALHTGDGNAANNLYDRDQQLEHDMRKMSDENSRLKSSLQDYKDALQNARAAATKPAK